MNNWYVGVQRTLLFTVGALQDGDTIFLDHWKPYSVVDVPVAASIVNQATGACMAVVTPDQAGVWTFWPRIMHGDVIVDIGRPKTRRVRSPGDNPSS
jgi:hypothetical protein